jgi:hypothetical protein
MKRRWSAEQGRSVMRMLVAAVSLALPVVAWSAAPAASAGPVSPARIAAMHECGARAARYVEYTWGNMEFQQYRACMAERRQME